MSDYVSPKYTPRQLNLQQVNTYVAVHDLNCNCKNPLRHIIKQIQQQEPTLKCHHFTTAEDGNQDGDVDIDGFGPGELEKLFAEDTAEKDG